MCPNYGACCPISLPFFKGENSINSINKTKPHNYAKMWEMNVEKIKHSEH